MERVDSTNRYAADAARRGAEEGLVVIAEEQSAGRGRLDRRWIAPRGSALLCSVLLRPAFLPAAFHLLTSALALAARAAILETSDVLATLKWPNDLLVNERKLGGILAEVLAPHPGDPLAGEQGSQGVVIGIGLNLEWPESFGNTEDERAITANATTLAIEGVNPGRGLLLDAFLCDLEARYRRLSTPAGRAETMAAYRSACSTIGQEVRVIQANGEWLGYAEAIDDEGRLVVRRGEEVLPLDAADVVHLRAEASEG